MNILDGRTTDNIFNVVARGTSAPYRGVSPEKTTASSHPIGAKVYGSRPVTMIQTTSVNDANTTVTEENSYLVPALVIGLAFLNRHIFSRWWFAVYIRPNK